MMLGTTNGTEQQLRDIGDFMPHRGWKLQRADELVSSPITKGATPSPHLNTKNATVPFLKVYNLTFSGNLDFTIDPTYVEPQVHEKELKRSRVRSGDILMNLGSDLAQKWLEKRSKKTSGQRNLTLGLAQELPVPIPPKEVIAAVVKTLGEFSAAKQSVEDVLKNAISLGHCITNQL